MSFSLEVKKELLEHYDKAANLKKAELCAVLLFAPRAVRYDEAGGVYVCDFTTDKKTYNINGKLDLKKTAAQYTAKPEAKRAFLRGAFISAGTLAAPEKEYHLDISAPDDETAGLAADMMEAFDVRPKLMSRRGKTVVYLKGSEDISMLLNVMGASKALMKFENIRIEREINGSVNRKINCDSANIRKTVSASLSQIEDIEFLMECGAFERLTEPLKEICLARLEHPDATFDELGGLLPIPVGKSGVNHRLRKVSETAAKLRQQQ